MADNSFARQNCRIATAQAQALVNVTVARWQPLYPGLLGCVWREEVDMRLSLWQWFGFTAVEMEDKVKIVCFVLSDPLKLDD